MTAFQVGPGMCVRLRYAAFDEEGERVEEQAQELAYVHGYGSLLPALEAAVSGRVGGTRCEVTLSPREAFGPRRKEAILECDPAEFPQDVAAGDRLEVDTAEGGILVLRVLEVGPDVVVVDANHPLSGQRVRFELEILEVRPATAAELARAEARLSADQPAGGPLMPVQRLLRPPSQRYELGPLAGAASKTEPGGDES